MKIRQAMPHVAVGLCILVWTVALSCNTADVPQRQSEQSKENAVVRVEAKYVCMVNNQRFEKEQIAIVVEGRTYYGCCDMCKETLRNDPRSRAAVDPVNGKEVDKAKAVIGVSPEGKAFYFENVENLKRFRANSESSDSRKSVAVHRHARVAYVADNDRAQVSPRLRASRAGSLSARIQFRNRSQPSCLAL